MPPPTNDETVQALATLAKESGVDSFWIRVCRKGPIGGQTQVARFEGASISYVARCEEWLLSLVGGGVIILNIGHGDAVSSPHYLTLALAGNPHPVDVSALERADWKGPMNLTMWEGQAVPPPAPTPMPLFSAGRGGPPGAQVAPAQQGIDPNTQRIADLERQLARREEQAESERRFAQLQADQERRFSLLQSELASSRSRPEKSNAIELVAALAPVLAPLLAGMSESRKQQFDALQASAAAQQELMRTLLTAKPESSAIDRVLDAFKTMAAENQKLIKQLTERGEPSDLESTQQALGLVQQTTLAMVKMSMQVAEANAGAGGSWVKDILGALEPIAQSIARRGPPQPAAPALPPARSQQPVAPPAAVPQPPPQPQPPQQPQAVIPTLIAGIKGFDKANAGGEASRIAAAVVGLIKSGNAEFIGAVQAAGGIRELAGQHLESWAIEDPRNLAFLRGLMGEIERQGLAAGVIETGEQPGGAVDEEADPEQ